MKKIIILLSIFLLILVYGCNKEEAISLDKTVTANVIKDIKIGVAEEGIKENITTVRLCYDSDNGIVRWVNGSVFGFYDNATRFEFIDYCQNKNYLIEFYCENETPSQRRFLCRNGCVDAHCA